MILNLIWWASPCISFPRNCNAWNYVVFHALLPLNRKNIARKMSKQSILAQWFSIDIYKIFSSFYAYLTLPLRSNNIVNHVFCFVWLLFPPKELQTIFRCCFREVFKRVFLGSPSASGDLVDLIGSRLWTIENPGFWWSIVLNALQFLVEITLKLNSEFTKDKTKYRSQILAWF